MRPRRLLVTDADNTLWETDGVYAAAQLDLLSKVERTYGISIKTDDRLKFVREFDQALAFQHPRGLRYPTALLVQTIISTVRTGDTERSVFDAVRHEGTDPEAEDIANAFIQRVSCEVPSLRTGVATAIPRLAECDIEIVVLTEGDLARCTRLLEQHGLTRYVSATISEDKTVESYIALRSRLGRADQPLMVGDQIDRDIELSKIAGYTAVYFPGGFNPAWARERQVTPDYVITSFEHMMPIIGVAWRSDHCDGDSGSVAAPFDNHQHPWRELSIEGSKEGRFVSAAGGGRRPIGSLSFARKLAERSSPSRLRCAAQNQRGLDCSGPFYKHLTYMKEREPLNFAWTNVAPPAGRRGPSWVVEFSTGTMGSFRPELTIETLRLI